MRVSILHWERQWSRDDSFVHFPLRMRIKTIGYQNAPLMLTKKRNFVYVLTNQTPRQEFRIRRIDLSTLRRAVELECV